MADFLLVTDLDQTLVGDDTALIILNELLQKKRREYDIKIVYSTGRSLELYDQLNQEKYLLSPDALITSVGTEIYFNPIKDNFDLQWANQVSENWDREAVFSVASHFADLVLQPLSEQTPFKVSYYLSENIAQEVIPRLKADLAREKLETQVIYSASYTLDILPKNGGKGAAVQYLRGKWNLSADKTVVCGDSGNDITLFQGEERGIIVGNAKSELLQWYYNHKTPFRYLAKQHCAKGILEGLNHFGFITT
ncbi:sucrose phosphate synthase [Crocosphaera subtropica ATCC 51142]|uniref:sucrose-phosphate phosphatase n=1 Tax=Crocosphaera subtropica (strain ATCC 51142 / BH68) TaxID=43989 RepID=B1WUV6_CROS5|nr:sucrose-phosphate phosphatase [Crocosphaera subtropica]ACB50557.1 sucrose phosphate synthase [Crocosphaera subtropica ATCC 51142]